MEISPEAKAFMDKIVDEGPERLTGMDVAAVIGALCVTYLTGPNMVRAALAQACDLTDYHFVQEGTPCDCDKCTSRRKKEMH